jgi:large subunit ribosomal protein L29
VKASELREMTRDEIARRLAELRDEQFKLRLRRATETLPNPLRLRMLRRDIARCMTIQAELERAEKVAKPAGTKDE